MALPARRAYAGAAPACTLSSDISNSATSFSITGTTTNWPTTATGPFYMVIDPGLSTEEKVLVGARTTGSLSSVTRGVDGTSGSAHVAGATCYPVFTAVDANEANLLASTMTTKGDLISTDGSDPKRVAVGSNNTRLVADSAQTSGIKWVADTQNTVIDAKGDLLVGSAADTVARLAVGANGKVLEAASGETTGLKWGGTIGLEFVSSGSFSNAATVDVTGFSSTYKAYRVLIAPYRHSGTGATDVTATLRTSGGAATGGYYGAGWYVGFTGGSGAVGARNNGTDMIVGTVFDSNRTTRSFIDVGSVGASGLYPSVTGYYYDFANAYNVSFGYELSNAGNTIDRIRLACAVNISGEWRVYGYREP